MSNMKIKQFFKICRRRMMWWMLDKSTKKLFRAMGIDPQTQEEEQPNAR